MLNTTFPIGISENRHSIFEVTISQDVLRRHLGLARNRHFRLVLARAHSLGRRLAGDEALGDHGEMRVGRDVDLHEVMVLLVLLRGHGHSVIASTFLMAT